MGRVDGLTCNRHGIQGGGFGPPHDGYVGAVDAADAHLAHGGNIDRHAG